ncbi:hypothetical protein GCK72_017222 [Caenorhabditis remanei]|nr:hypothetical protein GCK72_017222 [Caenorhabditis remanei]KAF1750671.1 hypothetical protein GCK72_017222 [Caenorhabditis remanei]
MHLFFVFFALIQIGLREFAPAPPVGTILENVDDTPCENIKCYGQNECKMVQTYCNATSLDLCPPAPLCTIVILKEN